MRDQSTEEGWYGTLPAETCVKSTRFRSMNFLKQFHIINMRHEIKTLAINNSNVGLFYYELSVELCECSCMCIR